MVGTSNQSVPVAWPLIISNCIHMFSTSFLITWIFELCVTNPHDWWLNHYFHMFFKTQNVLLITCRVSKSLCFVAPGTKGPFWGHRWQGWCAEDMDVATWGRRDGEDEESGSVNSKKTHRTTGCGPQSMAFSYLIFVGWILWFMVDNWGAPSYLYIYVCIYI